MHPIARHIATGMKVKRTDGIAMFFLLRIAFWLGLVLVLLPTDKGGEPDKKSPQIGASDAVMAASAAVSDMSQFCKRQPAACEVGGEAASAIGARMQAGARKAYQMITDKTAEPNEKADKPEKTDKVDKGTRKSPDHTSSIAQDVASLQDPKLAPADTLTPADLDIEWRPPTSAPKPERAG